MKAKFYSEYLNKIIHSNVVAIRKYTTVLEVNNKQIIKKNKYILNNDQIKKLLEQGVEDVSR